MSSGKIPEQHKKLLNEGWIRRFTVQEPRLSEMKELYMSLGMEVTVEDAIPDDSQECRCCFDLPQFSQHYKTIYTRGEASAVPDPEQDLFD